MLLTTLLCSALSFVDPMVGTEGVGSEYGGMMPMTGVPFGSMHLVPVTRTNKVGRTSYNALDRDLLGFILTRQPAIWMGEFGPVRIWLEKPLKIDSIDAHPWQTTVKAGGRTYELAATSHGALIRSDDPSLGAKLADSGITTERTARVSMKAIPNFACRWSKRRDGNILAVGVSLISAANAEKHRPAGDNMTFDAVVAEARAKWGVFFDRVVLDASDRVKRIFYTGLYHALLYPRDLSEGGRYYSAVDDKVHEGPGYSCFSLWDTYRSEHPLLTLVAPERAGAMCQSLVDMYTWGGWLPIWPNPGYTGVMIGDPAAIVLSEAYVKGIRGFDAETAFAACLKNADVPQPDDTERTWFDSGADVPGCPETRGGLTWYLSLGYVAHDKTTESVSRTLDYSLADASIAKFAAALGKADEAKRFAARGRNYTNLWCTAEKCFLPRATDGKWVDPKKLVWANHAYTETNERSARWCVPHDVEGLVKLMGGPDEFERELDAFFETDFYRTDTVGNSSVHGNETCHHVAYLYNRIGRYDKTCRRVRDILTRCYSDSRRGFDGNEDCGAMSAWYVLSSLGLYPLDPASGDYELGSPLVDGATLRLGDKTLKIVVKRAQPDAWRTTRVTLNGRELANRRVSHAELVKGGTLEFEMASADDSVRSVLLAKQHGARPIQRTMKALEASTREHPAVVRVLFYGQSIVGQKWHPLVIDELKRRYPTAVFEVENRAIGGFKSPDLSRTAESDLYPFYPDLVFFHVYGPMDKYEAIVRKIRETTTAEIVLWTSHLRREDCDTREKVEQAAASWDSRSQKIAEIAAKYGCLFVDLRDKWARMMLSSGYTPDDLLGDVIHLKTSGPGFAAYAKFLSEALVRTDGDGDSAYSGTIETVSLDDPRVRKGEDGSLTLDFDGNRVVAVADGNGAGAADLLLDGRSVRDFAEMYYTTLPSTLVSWMPMIRHVDIAPEARPIAEDWTFTYLEGTDPRGKAIHYKVEGSVTGFDGEGWSTNDFRSISGRAVISCDDMRRASWQYGYFVKPDPNDPKAARPGQKVTWSVKPLFADPYASAATGVRTVLVQNCGNAKHRLTLRPRAGARFGVSAFIVYRPVRPSTSRVDH